MRGPSAMAGTSPVAANARSGVRRLRLDTGARPFLVLLELTRACELACRHCRAEAIREPEPGELGTAEVRRLLDDLAALGSPRPIVVFTGGDPLQRPDLTSLVRYATGAGVAAAVSPAGTPRASRAYLGALHRAGAHTVSFSLDGASPVTQDAFRGVPGSFAWTLAGCRAARAVGMRLQVNTTVSVDTVGELPAVCRQVAELGASLWSVFFLIPVGRARSLRALSTAETEDVLEFLHDVAVLVPLKTTEAPAFRRVLLQHRAPVPGRVPVHGSLYWDLHRRLDLLGPPASGWPGAGGRGSSPDVSRRSALAVGDGRGVVFVSRRGGVLPSGFLPLVAGNIRDTPLSVIYASSPLLRALRDPSRLSGRCGRCELAEVCGGSRAQAYARTGDPFGEDPSCAYEPPTVVCGDGPAVRTGA